VHPLTEGGLASPPPLSRAAYIFYCLSEQAVRFVGIAWMTSHASWSIGTAAANALKASLVGIIQEVLVTATRRPRFAGERFP
jgi:hypothetical protein